MAKSWTIEKVSNHIPDDLAFSVLSKLPLKSLKRFGCVNKTWSVLFQNPNFMTMYHNNFISIPRSDYNDTSLLLHQTVYDNEIVELNFSLHSLSGEKYKNRLKLKFPNPFQEEDPSFYILGSGIITEIICLYKGNKVILWNPTTDEFKVIPPSSIEFVPQFNHWRDSCYFSGFGYDHVTDDYKIIRCVWLDGKEDMVYETLWKIYSLKCNSWKKIDINVPTNWFYRSEQGVFLDGIYYWCYISESNHDEHYLVSFDLTNEVSLTTFMPSDIDANVSNRKIELLMLNGSFASISWYLHVSIFYISILGEFGVKGSWTTLFVVVGSLPPKISAPKERERMVKYSLKTMMED